MSDRMTATGCTVFSKDRRALLALGAAVLAALSVLAIAPSTSADSTNTGYDGEFDLYGYEITMMLDRPERVSTVTWDFGDGSEKITIELTNDNPNGKTVHRFAAKGDYTVTATMNNQYTNSAGQLVVGESKLVYIYHILGYPIVTFDSQGGSPVPAIEGTYYKFTIEKPADPTRDGFKFTGWYTDKECTKPFNWTTEIIGRNYTLYAGWTANVMHTVSFDLTGGSGNIPDVKVADGAKISEPDAPTREGFEFDGWYIGDEKYDFDSPVTSDITLVAHWTDKPATSGDDSDDKGWLWILFAILAVVCLAGFAYTRNIYLVIGAALFAILAVLAYLGVF